MFHKRSDEELLAGRKNCENTIASVDDFHSYFQGLDKYTKKQVVEKYGTYPFINGDWRSHAIKTAKKADMPEVVKKIHRRTLESCLEQIKSIDEELSNRENNRKKIALRRQREEWLHGLVDDWEDKNECTCGSDVDGIRFLIDDGSIKDEKELAEYGVY